MKWIALCLTLTLAAPTPALASTAAPSAASGLPVPSAADVDKAATSAATALNGVLRNCPSAYLNVGTPGKRCVGVSGDVETVRTQLSAGLGDQLYGVWRSRDDQRSVYNWVKMPSGSVYVRIQNDEGASGRSLVYLDAPTVAPQGNPAPNNAAGGATPAPGVSKQTKSNAKPTPTAGQPAQTPKAQNPAAQGKAATKPVTNAAPAKASATFQAPSPSSAGTATSNPKATLPTFTRTLQLSNPRFNGPDVLAVQTRLIALTLGGSGGQGDGWYGPNTDKTVRDFQAANGLNATGVIDQVTWKVLFSASAKPFQAADK